MKRVLVLQHVDHETLGTLAAPIRQRGFRVQRVNFRRHPDARPSLDGVLGLVILGGPMNVDEVGRYPHLAAETELICAAIEQSVPVLGICLGAQLIAKALGARVYPNREKEIGWYKIRLAESALQDRLLAHCRPVEHVFQWHGDTFDIPSGAVLLASSPLCTNQAFRYGVRVYALQFHLEVNEPLIHRWLRVPGNRRELAALDGLIDAQKIRAETQLYAARLFELSQQTFHEFARLCES